MSKSINYQLNLNAQGFKKGINEARVGLDDLNGVADNLKDIGVNIAQGDMRAAAQSATTFFATAFGVGLGSKLPSAVSKAMTDLVPKLDIDAVFNDLNAAFDRNVGRSDFLDVFSKLDLGSLSKTNSPREMLDILNRINDWQPDPPDWLRWTDGFDAKKYSRDIALVRDSVLETVFNSGDSGKWWSRWANASSKKFLAEIKSMPGLKNALTAALDISVDPKSIKGFANQMNAIQDIITHASMLDMVDTKGGNAARDKILGTIASWLPGRTDILDKIKALDYKDLTVDVVRTMFDDGKVLNVFSDQMLKDLGSSFDEMHKLLGTKGEAFKNEFMRIVNLGGTIGADGKLIDTAAIRKQLNDLIHEFDAFRTSSKTFWGSIVDNIKTKYAGAFSPRYMAGITAGYLKISAAAGTAAIAISAAFAVAALKSYKVIDTNLKRIEQRLKTMGTTLAANNPLTQMSNQASVEKLVKAYSDAFSAEEILQAFNWFLNSGMTFEQAMANMGRAANLAASQMIPLQDSAEEIGQVWISAGEELEKWGYNVKKVAGKDIEYIADVFKQIDERTKGAVNTISNRSPWETAKAEALGLLQAIGKSLNSSTKPIIEDLNNMIVGIAVTMKEMLDDPAMRGFFEDLIEAMVMAGKFMVGAVAAVTGAIMLAVNNIKMVIGGVMALLGQVAKVAGTLSGSEDLKAMGVGLVEQGSSMTAESLKSGRVDAIKLMMAGFGASDRGAAERARRAQERDQISQQFAGVEIGAGRKITDEQAAREAESRAKSQDARDKMLQERLNRERDRAKQAPARTIRIVAPTRQRLIGVN